MKFLNDTLNLNVI